MMASTASKTLRVLMPGLLLPALMAHAGGWAVITVDDLPDYVEAAKPVTLSFTVRQHGVTPLDQLTPSIRATSGRLTANGTVRSADGAGHYTASLTFPSAGDWSVSSLARPAAASSCR